jgi:hypothetical protein
VAKLYSGTATDQINYPDSAITGSATVITSTLSITTAWQRVTLFGNVGATATQLFAGFEWTPSGTAGAADYYEITGVQLEQNYQATPFEQRPFGVELALCQRYYENSYDNGVAVGTLSATGSTAVIYSSASGAATGFGFMVRKRVTPAVRGYPYISATNNGVGFWTSASDGTNRAVTFGNISPKGMRYIALTGASVNSWYEGHYEADAEL